MDAGKKGAMGVIVVIVAVVVLVVAVSVKTWHERSNPTMVNQGPTNQPMTPQGPATPSS